MSLPIDNKTLLRSQKTYEWLLVAYPKLHREEYGPAMSQLFRDQCRDAWREARHWGLTRLWLRVLPDLIKTSIVERFSALNERKSMFEQTGRTFSSTPGATVHVSRGVCDGVYSRVNGECGDHLPYAGNLCEHHASQGGTGTSKLPSRCIIHRSVPAYDPYFIQTTFEIMQNAVVLGPVIDKLNLNVKWSRKYNGGLPLNTQMTMKLLKQRLSLDIIRNTKIIEITSYDEDKTEAAQIANAIIQAYRNYRVKIHNEAMAREIHASQNQYQLDDVQIQKTAARGSGTASAVPHWQRWYRSSAACGATLLEKKTRIGRNAQVSSITGCQN